MKKIVVVNNNLNLGGIQKSLIEFLKLICLDNDVTLVLFDKNGALLPKVPREVKIVELGFPIKQLGIAHSENRQYGVAKYFQSFILRGYTKFFGKKNVVKYILKKTDMLDGEYDVAISYSHNTNDKYLYASTNEYVLNKIKAKKKITYMHGDFLECGTNTDYNVNIMNQFDTIVAVSEYCRDRIIKGAPQLVNKIKIVHNATDYDEIQKLANDEPIIYDNSFINIVSVARLSSEKGVLRAIKILNKLIQEGFNIKFYIVGDGPQKQEIMDYINSNNLQNNIYLYGFQVNPYRFIKNANIFLLSSYQEAAPMVLNEAIALSLPIVATNTGHSKKIITNDLGIVCENSDDAIYKALKLMIQEKLYLGYKHNLEKVEKNNNNIKSEIMEVL